MCSAIRLWFASDSDSLEFSSLGHKSICFYKPSRYFCLSCAAQVQMVSSLVVNTTHQGLGHKPKAPTSSCVGFDSDNGAIKLVD